MGGRHRSRPRTESASDARYGQAAPTTLLHSRSLGFSWNDSGSLLSLRSLGVLALPLTLVSLVTLAGCSASGTSAQNSSHLGAGGSGNGSGLGTGGGIDLNISGSSNGNGTGGDSCGQVLPVVFRDFKGSHEPGGHIDFEASGRMVRQMDGQIFKGWNEIGCGLVEPTLGADSKPIAYTAAPDAQEGSSFVYDSTAFFPIDGQGFGNTPGQTHNYSFRRLEAGAFLLDELGERHARAEAARENVGPGDSTNIPWLGQCAIVR